MRSSLWPAAALIFGVTLLGTPSPACAQVARMSLDELTSTATSILHGRATHSQAVWSEDGKRIYTEVTLEVQDQLKGRSTKTTVVTVPGGQIGDIRYEVSDMPAIDEGEEVLVFVWQHPSGRNLVTGGAQGKLSVERPTTLSLPQVTGPFGVAIQNAGKKAGGDAQAVIGLADLKTRIRTLVGTQ